MPPRHPTTDRTKTTRWLQLLTLLCLLPSAVFAQDAVPIAQQAKLLLKAISYDRNLKKRSGTEVHIAVIHQGANEAATEIVTALTAAGATKVKGLSVKATGQPFTDVQDLLKRVDAQKYNVLYVHPSALKAISSIQQVARGKKVLSMGANKGLVEKGLSLGVYLHKSKPRLVVNQRAAKVEGLDLEPAIKLISTVIK